MRKNTTQACKMKNGTRDEFEEFEFLFLVNIFQFGVPNFLTVGFVLFLLHDQETEKDCEFEGRGLG
jgi:hypothetical protein